MALLVSAAMLMSDYALVQAESGIKGTRIPMKQQRANRLSKEHTRNMRK